jgi:hypothetical protein
MTYSINGSPVKEYTGIIKNLAKGTNTITITAFDQLGNSSVKEIRFIIE